ncbi:unnamed protein product [Fusarium equiseti]|uniref:Uncharacterized protein n=1 Tax=Fusarium equiseti TaxID=61235 RepID=A0A8J2J9B0_FUSEQ|nr:unnamed protein product [Fusarium equiseti]
MIDPQSVGASILGAFEQLETTLRLSMALFGDGFTTLGKLTQDLQRIQGLVSSNLVDYQITRMEQLGGEPVTRMLDSLPNVHAREYTQRAVNVIELCSALRERSINISHDIEQISEEHGGRGDLLHLRFIVQLKKLGQQLQDIRGILEQLQTLAREALPPSVYRDIPKGLIPHETSKGPGKVQAHAVFLQQILSESDLQEFDIFIYPVATTTSKSVSTFTVLFRRNTVEPTSESGWRRAIFKISTPSDESQSSDRSGYKRQVPLENFEDSRLSMHPSIEGGDDVLEADSTSELASHFSDTEDYLDQSTQVLLRYLPYNSSVSITFRKCEDLHRVSLKDVLRTNPVISLPARLTLAVELTKAALLLHWAEPIHGTLTPESVWFARDSNKFLMGSLLLPLKASRHRSTDSHHHDKSNASKSIGKDFSRVALMLGLVLVEVFIGHEVFQWNESADIISPGTLKNALAALDEIRLGWATGCSDAIQRCLLDFGWNAECESEGESFVKHVLKPLEELLHQFLPGRSVQRGKVVLAESRGRALDASQGGPFPYRLREAFLSDPRLSYGYSFRVFSDYTQSMLKTCESIWWLKEAFSKDGGPPSASRSISLANKNQSPKIRRDIKTSGSGNPADRDKMVQYGEIRHWLKQQSSASRNAVEMLQIQLRVDLEYMDSRDLARRILRGLRFGFGLTPIRRGELAIDDHDLSSNLRRILEHYCAEVQSIDQQDAPFPQSTQSSLCLKGRSMVLKEIEFLVEQLVSIYQGDANQSTIQPSDGTSARAEHQEEETVPFFAIRDFLMGGKAFGRLKRRIRRLVKQDIMEIISGEVLLDLPPTSPTLITATFHVCWEIFDHILNEQDGSTDISQILTVTGQGRDAYASRCADYLKWLWEDSKYDICSHFQQYLQEKSYEHPDATLTIDENTEGDSNITVVVVGTVETITEVAQQLAWLTAAFRSCPEGVTLSDVDFIATKRMQFFIEAGALTNVSVVTPTPDTCWHRLVRNVVIAHGFPIPPRSHQVGLELTYAAMLKLSQVSTLLIANKRLAFYGFSSFLFPMDQSSENNDSAQHLTQWHFERSDNTELYFDCADYLAESKSIWAHDVHESTLATSRNFVGYCRVSEFRLATSTSNFLNLLETPMPDASTTVGARIENLTAGTGGLGFGTLEFESNIRYAHSIVNAVAADEYLGTMDTLERMSMILWDCEDECGWLVPAQALLLHMAHVWVNSKGITADFRHASQGPGYLQEVDKILREDRKKVLRKEGRDDDSDFELRHLIMRIWNDIRGCYQAGGISGWEVTDFLTRPPLEFSMKQDKRGPSDKGWKGLAVEKNIPVLFCKGAGEVIKTTPPGYLCTNCRLSLKHQSYLIASLTCLGNMAQRYGGFKPKTRLTTEWGWQPTDEAALFQEHCQLNVGPRCNERLQRLITFKEEEDGTNLNLPANGVVVFGRAGSKAPELAATATLTTPTTTSVGKGKITKWLAKLKKKENASL